ncbi:helicase, partial [Patescibacteria group bacterium]|nr:helicase [Patescibacteria group bacterium]MBU4022968.1 helicase [Patescibacteria group bacterium]
YLGDCQYRQKDDNFIKLLNEIRKNKVSPANKKMLLGRKDSMTKNFIKPAKLLTHNNDVNAINSFELAKIKGKQKSYSMTFIGQEKLVNSLKNGCLAPEKLVLKKKAIVMFVKNNFEKGYVNGTMGEVVGFNKDSYPIIETISGNRITARPLSWELKEDEHELARITQIPLRLAWAITIHKCQGMTLDMAEIDLSRAFDYGMGYVALSRVRSFSGIKLLGINDLSFQVSEDAIELDKSLRKLSKKTEKNLEKMGIKKKREIQEDFVLKSTDKNQPYDHENNEEEDDEDQDEDHRVEYIDIEEIPF